MAIGAQRRASEPCARAALVSCQRLPAVLEEKSAKVCFDWLCSPRRFRCWLIFELASLHLRRRSQQFKYCNVLLVVGLPIERQRDDKQPYERVEGLRPPTVGTPRSWHVSRTRRRNIAADGWRLLKREGWRLNHILVTRSPADLTHASSACTQVLHVQS